MTQDVTLSFLRVFEAAGRTGSFRAAAAALKLTPSAVSHAIRKLEQALGIALFERDSRHARLSYEGEVPPRLGFVRGARGGARSARSLTPSSNPGRSSDWDGGKTGHYPEFAVLELMLCAVALNHRLRFQRYRSEMESIKARSSAACGLFASLCGLLQSGRSNPVSYPSSVVRIALAWQIALHCESLLQSLERRSAGLSHCRSRKRGEDCGCVSFLSPLDHGQRPQIGGISGGRGSPTSINGPCILRCICPAPADPALTATDNQKLSGRGHPKAGPHRSAKKLPH